MGNKYIKIEPGQDKEFLADGDEMAKTKDFKTIEDLFVEEQRKRTKWTVVGTLVKVFSAILKFWG
jgi:ABC-type transporter Mla subunit MlaD